VRRFLPCFLPWLLPAAFAAALAPPASGDFTLFHTAGKAFLFDDWSAAFADPAIQVGPFQLALFGSLGHAVGYVVAPALALLVVTAARVVGVREPQLLTLVGLVSILTGLTSSGIDSGHPANALLPLLWIVAAAQARRGKVVSAALVVGLGAGVETWGILGITVLALAPRLRTVVHGMSLAVGVAAALYAPFILVGQFHMGDYVWLVRSEALISALIDPGTPFGWPMRLVQGGCAVGAGLLLARLGRHSAHVMWLVPLVVVLVRLLLDPLGSGYYFVGIEAPALVGLALVSAWGIRLRRLSRELLA
jgi:hypothetical protein